MCNPKEGVGMGGGRCSGLQEEDCLPVAVQSGGRAGKPSEASPAELKGLAADKLFLSTGLVQGKFLECCVVADSWFFVFF